MANLTLRNVPDELHRRLKERAKRNRRSLNQEAIEELAAYREWPNGVADIESQARERMRNAAASIEELRKEMPRFLSAKEIDDAMRSGRK